MKHAGMVIALSAALTAFPAAAFAQSMMMSTGNSKGGATSMMSANPMKADPVVGVVTDYDKGADLKEAYGITRQDTFVQIDAGGKQLAAWTGGGVNGILAHAVRPQEGTQ